MLLCPFGRSGGANCTTAEVLETTAIDGFEDAPHTGIASGIRIEIGLAVAKPPAVCTESEYVYKDPGTTAKSVAETARSLSRLKVLEN